MPEKVTSYGLKVTSEYCSYNYGAHNVYYVKCTRTFKRHVKAAGFVHVKKLLAHKFDPFPSLPFPSLPCRDAERILLICTRYPAHDFTQHTPLRHKKTGYCVRFVIVSVSVQDEIVAQRISERPRHFRRKTLFTRCR